MMPTPEVSGRATYLDKLIGILGADFTDTGGKGKCCGFPILQASEENSLAMAARHTGEAKGKGADAMVTPCPLCHLNLDGNQPRAEAQTGNSDQSSDPPPTPDGRSRAWLRSY